MPFAHNILKTLTMLIINWIEPGVYACDALKNTISNIGMTTRDDNWFETLRYGEHTYSIHIHIWT